MRGVACLAAATGGCLGALGVIGADALWLVPLGGRVIHGHLPSSIPYAAAPSGGWHDVPAGAEVVFWAFFRAFGGDRGLVVAQALAAAVGLGALAHGLRREASDWAALAVSLLVIAGCLPLVVVTSISLFSLALFPVLLGLLEVETRFPSRRIWWSVPVLALWGNLHGGVLVGWALLACYLVFGRGRRDPLLAAVVLVAGTAALFVNPALWDTPRYYWSVFHNEAAREGVGLWTPLALDGFGIVLLAVVAVFVVLGVRRGAHVRLWEAVAIAGLAVATVHVARNGSWLLFVAAYPVARSLPQRELRQRIHVAVAGGLALAAVVLLVRGPPDPGSHALAERAAGTGRPVLGETVLGQQAVLAGGRVWLSNPVDAFRPADQRLYLDWLAGKPSGAEAVSHAALVLVRPGSAAGRTAARDPRLALVARGNGGALYRVKAGLSAGER
jgi:hypothetical protein